MNHFWRWARDETVPDERTLYLEGIIAEESWFDDDVTPAAFKSELYAEQGPVTVVINSPGGDTIAASQIYTMLKDYPYDVTAKITGIAASAASVVAMAGDKVCMSPTSMLMIHNPYTCAMGDSEDMRKAGQLLDEVKAGIINAYQIKTGLSRTRISHMMDDETWMNPIKAKELHFCDEILYQNEMDPSEQGESMFFSSAGAQRKVLNSLLAKVQTPTDDAGTNVSEASEETPSQAETLPAADEHTDTDAPTEPGVEPVSDSHEDVPMDETPDADVTPDALEIPPVPEAPPEPENPEGAEGPDIPADAEAQGISADSLYQRLSRLKYNY